MKHERFKHDFGINDYYKHYRSLHGDIDKSLYKSILEDFNLRIGEAIAHKGHSFKIPCGLGVIEWRKYRSHFSEEDERSIESFPIDKIKTLSLWRSQPEYRDSLTFIRHLNPETNRYVYKLVYFKSKSHFKNKGIYNVTIRQLIKLKSANPIKSGFFDAYEDDMFYRVRNRMIKKKIYGKHNKHKSFIRQDSQKSFDGGFEL